MDAPDSYPPRTNILFFQPVVDKYNNDYQSAGSKPSLRDPSEVQPSPDLKNIEETGKYRFSIKYKKSAIITQY